MIRESFLLDLGPCESRLYLILFIAPEGVIGE